MRVFDTVGIHGLQRWVRPAQAIFAVFFSAIFALQANAQCITENLARTGIATASTTFPGYSPARVNDGNRSTALGGATSWANNRFGTAILDITLPGAFQIDRIVLYTTSTYEVRDYDIQLRVGGVWQTVQAIRGNTNTVRPDNFAPQIADAVRIVGISGPTRQPGYVRINELEICRAAPAGGTVQGQVFLYREGANQPLGNVLVDLGGGLSVLTDAAGFYTINNIAVGTYTARASRAGLTCGSPAFQLANYTVNVVGTGTANFRDIICYDRNPIVYATGWTDNVARFDPVFGQLQREGYRGFDAGIETNQNFTPPFRVNAQNVSREIDLARNETGQPQVILFGHSMGGLVSRTYVESNLYRNDVSQLFTFGSPHRGIPNLASLACVANQPAVCQMSKPGMFLFNITHGQRLRVQYHSIGGDAPLLRKVPICFRIFRRRVCINVATLPIPDFRFRNFGGWLAGLLIPGPDDGLAQTYSSTGMPGLIDRYTTQEVHIVPQLGHRDYYNWNGGALSGQAYQECVRPVLVLRDRRFCNFFPTFQSIFGVFLKQQTPYFSANAVDETIEFGQRSRTDRNRIGPLQRTERNIWLDGSPTIFSAQWSAGSARVTLIDPSGHIFDPEFAASILDGEPLPGEPISDELDPNMMLFESAANAASYQFPAPRPGQWRMIVEAGADVPPGSDLDTNVVFASDLDLKFANDFPFFLANTQAEIRLTPTTAIFSGEGEAKVTRLDGVVDTVPLVRQTDGSLLGYYTVPSAPGLAEVSWFITGLRATGQPFERAGSDSVQISRRTLVVTGVGIETAVPSPQDPRQLIALDIPVDVQSEYNGPAMIAGDLVDVSGEIVANAALTQDVAAGSNRVVLSFDGADIFATRRNGPYRLTNLITADQRGATLLSDWLLDQLITNSYEYRQFGPPTPLACGATNLLRNGFASASSTYSEYDPARVIDGDRNTALGPAHSWSNARETDTTPALPASLSIALATQIVVDQVMIYTTADWEIRDYDLQYFDGAAWSTIEEVRDNIQTIREHRIPPTNLSGLRIVGRSGPDHQTVHVRANEIEAYRCDASAAWRPVFYSLTFSQYAKQAAGTRPPLRR